MKPGGCCIHTSSCKWQCKKTFLTLSCRIDHPSDVAIKRTVRIVIGLITGLKVSTQSTPSCWLKPLATRRALYRSTEPSARCLRRYTHLQMITFWDESGGTISHVWFWRRACNSYIIASRHSGDFCAWENVVGSCRIVETLKATGWRETVNYRGGNVPSQEWVTIWWVCWGAGASSKGLDVSGDWSMCSGEPVWSLEGGVCKIEVDKHGEVREGGSGKERAEGVIEGKELPSRCREPVKEDWLVSRGALHSLVRKWGLIKNYLRTNEYSTRDGI